MLTGSVQIVLLFAGNMSSLFDKLFKTNQGNQRRFGMLYESFLKCKKRRRFQSERRIKSKSSLIDKSKFLYDIPDSMIFPNTADSDETEENADAFLKEFGEFLDKDDNLPEEVLLKLGLSHLIEKNEQKITVNSDNSQNNAFTNKMSTSINTSPSLSSKAATNASNVGNTTSSSQNNKEIMNQINSLKRKYGSSPSAESRQAEFSTSTSKVKNNSQIKPSIINKLAPVSKKPFVETKSTDDSQNKPSDKDTDALEIVFCQTKKNTVKLGPKKSQVPPEKPVPRPTNKLSTDKPIKPLESQVVNGTKTFGESLSSLTSPQPSQISTPALLNDTSQPSNSTRSGFPPYINKDFVNARGNENNKKKKKNKNKKKGPLNHIVNNTNNMFDLLVKHMHLVGPYLTNYLNSLPRNEGVPQDSPWSGLPEIPNSGQFHSLEMDHSTRVLSNNHTLSQPEMNHCDTLPPIDNDGGDQVSTSNHNSHPYITPAQKRLSEIFKRLETDKTSENEIVHNKSEEEIARKKQITNLIMDSISNLTSERQAELDVEVKTEQPELGFSEDNVQVSSNSNEENQNLPETRRPLIFLKDPAQLLETPQGKCIKNHRSFQKLGV